MLNVIYGILCKADGEHYGWLYIGQSRNFIKRKAHELWSLRAKHFNRDSRTGHYNHKLQKDWDKYGEKCFAWSILEVVPNTENLNEKEIWWIKETSSIENGYNIAYGGQVPFLGRKHSQESKDKISKANYGRIPTEATRGKLRIARSKWRHSEETKRKIGSAHTGKKRSAAARKNMSTAHLGHIPWNKGRKVNESADTISSIQLQQAQAAASAAQPQGQPGGGQ